MRGKPGRAGFKGRARPVSSASVLQLMGRTLQSFTHAHKWDGNTSDPRKSHYFDLTNEETEALRSQVTCLR